MTDLLKIEWLKVKAYRTFWILSGLFLIGVPLICWAYESILLNANQMISAYLSSFSFPKVWETAAWLGSWMSPVMGILLIISLTNENNFRTVRQNIIDGWSREQFFFAKYGTMISAAIFMTAVMALTSLFFGLKSGRGSVGDGTEFIWYAFVQNMTYLSLAFFLGIYMRRAGIAIAIYVMYAYIGEMALMGLLEFKVKFHSSVFLPLECTDRLIPGDSGIVRNLVREGGAPPSKATLQLIAFGWIILFGLLGWRKMKKSDI